MSWIAYAARRPAGRPVPASAASHAVVPATSQHASTTAVTVHRADLGDHVTGSGRVRLRVAGRDDDEDTAVLAGQVLDDVLGALLPVPRARRVAELEDARRVGAAGLGPGSGHVGGALAVADQDLDADQPARGGDGDVVEQLEQAEPVGVDVRRLHGQPELGHRGGDQPGPAGGAATTGSSVWAVAGSGAGWATGAARARAAATTGR